MLSVLNFEFRYLVALVKVLKNWPEMRDFPR